MLELALILAALTFTLAVVVLTFTLAVVVLTLGLAVVILTFAPVDTFTPVDDESTYLILSSIIICEFFTRLSIKVELAPCNPDNRPTPAVVQLVI